MKSGKRHMTERIELPNKKHGILEADSIKLVDMKEKLKRVSQENKKATRDKTM